METLPQENGMEKFIINILMLMVLPPSLKQAISKKLVNGKSMTILRNF